MSFSNISYWIEDENITMDVPCNVSESIVTAPYFIALLSVEMLASLVGGISNTLLLVLIWRLRVVHANLRCLMAHLSFVLTWFALATFIKASRLLINGQSANSCKLVSVAYSCRLEELPHVMAITSTIYSLISILLERLYSTVRYRSYDRSSHVPWLAIVLIPMVWAASLAYQLLGLKAIPSSQVMPLCENILSVEKGAAASRLASTIFVETAGIVTALLIYFYNGRKFETMAVNRAKHTLTSRFQISQNVELNRFIVPSTLMLVCCYLPNHVYLLLVVYGLDVEFGVRTYLVHLNYLWKLLYCIVHPILVFKRSSHLRMQLQRSMPQWLARLLLQQKMVQVSVIEAERVNAEAGMNGDTHFELLAKMWNSRVKENQ